VWGCVCVCRLFFLFHEAVCHPPALLLSSELPPPSRRAIKCRHAVPCPLWRPKGGHIYMTSTNEKTIPPKTHQAPTKSQCSRTVSPDMYSTYIYNISLPPHPNHQHSTSVTPSTTLPGFLDVRTIGGHAANRIAPRQPRRAPPPQDAKE
jgi:hypothetical protein